MGSPAHWHRLPVDDLPPGGRKLVHIAGREVAVFRAEGALYALDNACPHAGNPLVEGELVGRTLVCAYHAWKFDLETGACLFGDEPARTYPVEVRGSDAWILL